MSKLGRQELLAALGELLDEFEEEILSDYLGSTDFEEAACTYCEEQGWKRPE